MTIFLIALLVFLFSYFFIFDEITKKNTDNLKERIYNQNNSLNKSDIDIKEIEKQLDELDVNIDDVFEQL